MARSIKQIYDAIIAEKNAQSQLNGLQPSIDSAQTLLNDITTPSKVADWRVWVWVVAVACWVEENMWDIFKAEVETIIASIRPGSLPWYRQQALNFQYGYALVYLNDKYQYSVIDINAQIIKRAAVVEVGGQLRFKIAKLVGGVVTPLSSGELAAFDAYINQIKYAGTNTATISRVPDLLKVAYTVYYDPLVLAADGSLISDPSTFPIEDAINNYISNLPFNGDLVLTSLTDAVQLASGVVNPVLTQSEAKYGSLPYTAFTVKYNPDAGHLGIDPAFPLSTQITYIANV